MIHLAIALALAGVAQGQQQDCERVSATTLDCHGIVPTRTQLIPPVRYEAPTSVQILLPQPQRTNNPKGTAHAQDVRHRNSRRYPVRRQCSCN